MSLGLIARRSNAAVTVRAEISESMVGVPGLVRKGPRLTFDLMAVPARRRRCAALSDRQARMQKNGSEQNRRKCECARSKHGCP